MQHNGYFDTQVTVDHDAPRLNGDHYLVNLVLTITPGLQYHMGEISGDGGPLFRS